MSAGGDGRGSLARADCVDEDLGLGEGGGAIGAEGTAFGDHVMEGGPRSEVHGGRLKGLLVGGALRWEAGKISGYRYSPTLGFLDVNQPLMGPTDQHLDVWVGYSRKLKYRDMLWKVQLNVRNLGEGTRLVPAYYEPDGSLALSRIQTGTLGFLTNSLKL